VPLRNERGRDLLLRPSLAARFGVKVMNFRTAGYPFYRQPAAAAAWFIKGRGVPISRIFVLSL